MRAGNTVTHTQTDTHTHPTGSRSLSEKPRESKKAEHQESPFFFLLVCVPPLILSPSQFITAIWFSWPGSIPATGKIGFAPAQNRRTGSRIGASRAGHFPQGTFHCHCHGIGQKTGQFQLDKSEHTAEPHTLMAKRKGQNSQKSRQSEPQKLALNLTYRLPSNEWTVRRQLSWSRSFCWRVKQGCREWGFDGFDRRWVKFIPQKSVQDCAACFALS